MTTTRTTTEGVDLEDTIVAEATPHGRGGVALVRLSGPRAHSIAGTLFSPSRAGSLGGRRCVHGRVAAGELRDEATCTLFDGPRSYTGEDVAELGLHGNPWIVLAIVEEAVARGARVARPGEFTYRAHCRGRIDLARAEALDALIGASSPAVAREAARQAERGLEDRIGPLAELLLDALAELEAAVDFHDDSVGQRRIDEALARLADAVASWKDGNRRAVTLTEGVRVVLAGPPNAGKSSLFNALLQADRAIVTEEPGTTRDVLEGRLVLDGLALTLVDTAGEREAASAAEAEGVRRTREERLRADIVLEVRDATEADAFLPPAGARSLRVLTKSDLLPAGRGHDEADHLVSSVSGSGLEALLSVLAVEVRAATAGEGPVLLAARQRAVALRVLEHVDAALEARASSQPEEYVAECLRWAQEALADLVGHADVEDVYDRVFRRFCIGK